MAGGPADIEGVLGRDREKVTEKAEPAASDELTATGPD